MKGNYTMKLVNKFTKLTEYINQTLWRADNIRVSSIRLIGTPISDEFRKRLITYRLFAQNPYLKTELGDSMYVETNVSDSNKADILVQSIGEHMLCIDSKTAIKTFYLRTDTIQWFADNIYCYGSLVSFCGLFEKPGSFNIFSVSDCNNKPVIIQFHDKPKSIDYFTPRNTGSFLGYGEKRLSEENNLRLIKDLSKLNTDISIMEIKEIMDCWFGGLVLVGDFSDVIDTHFCSWDMAFIGKLPHKNHKFLLEILRRTVADGGTIYITDEEAYNIILSLKPKGYEKDWSKTETLKLLK